MSEIPDESKPIPLREQSVPEIAAKLQEVLGQHMTAYALADDDPTIVGAFARGDIEPTKIEESTLRDLAQVTEFLLAEEECSPELARAVLLGMNHSLNDNAAIELFHQGESERVVESLSYLIGD
jgi:hypothetical protein